jgi:hypothetical protein
LTSAILPELVTCDKLLEIAILPKIRVQHPTDVQIVRAHPLAIYTALYGGVGIWVVLLLPMFSVQPDFLDVVQSVDFLFTQKFASFTTFFSLQSF